MTSYRHPHRPCAANKKMSPLIHSARWFLCVLKNRNFVSLNNDTGEFAGRIGAGIDIDPVRPQVDGLDRRMTVHDNFGKLSFIKKKIVADPQQVRLALLA